MLSRGVVVIGWVARKSKYSGAQIAILSRLGRSGDGVRGVCSRVAVNGSQVSSPLVPCVVVDHHNQIEVADGIFLPGTE